MDDRITNNGRGTQIGPRLIIIHKLKAHIMATKRSIATIDRRNERMIYLVVGADSEPERIPVYNQILRSASPKFRRLVESMDLESVELEIVDVSKKIMSILIEYIYQTFQDCEAHLPVTDTNVHDLYMAANNFDLDDVKSLCRDYLESIEINEENCIQLFLKNSESTSFNFRRCLEFILSSLGQLFTTQSFINLTATHLVLIIREGLATGKSSEDVLCEAAINWMKNRSQEISAEVKELIVDFPCKDHKTMILQALRKIPNPNLKDFAFDLLMKLYTEESKSMATDTTTTEIDGNHNNTPSTSTTESCGNKSSDHDNQHTPNNNSNITTTNCEATAQVSQLKRSFPPLPTSEEGSSCSQPKKNKSQPSQPEDEAPTSTTTESVNDVAVGSDNSSDVKGSKIYFTASLAGVKQLYSLNLQNFGVKCVSPLPQRLSVHENSSMQCYRGEIFFMGGKCLLSTRDVHIYNLEKNSWTMVKMCESRYDCQSACLDGSIFVIGGRQKRWTYQTVSSYVNNVEKLHLDTKSWMEVEKNLAHPRHRCGVVIFNKRIYSIGGYTETPGLGWQASGVCETFDPESTEKKRKWKKLQAVLSTPRYALVACATETEIWAIGGRGQDGKSLTTVEVMRAGSDFWEVGPELNKARANASGVYCKEQNAIFVFGGDSEENPTVEELDLETQTWSLVCNQTFTDDTSFLSVAFEPCVNE